MPRLTCETPLANKRQTVVAVERDEALAAVAASVVDRNGAGEAVCMVAAHSTDIEVPQEGRFDVIVSEVLGSDPLSEGALPTLRHASERLLAPDGELVPARIILRAALAQAGSMVAATMRAHGPGGGLDCSVRPGEKNAPALCVTWQSGTRTSPAPS